MGRNANILLQSLYLDKPVSGTDCRSGPKELKKFGYSVRLAPVNDAIEYANQLKLLSKTKLILKNIILNKNILIFITKVSIIYFNENMEKFAVIGLGYVGLPLALSLSNKYNVVAFDNDKLRINTLKNGIDFNNEFKKSDLKKKKFYLRVKKTI